MVRCRHPNIVQFLGYVDSPFVIVMEFLPKATSARTGAAPRAGGPQDADLPRRAPRAGLPPQPAAAQDCAPRRQADERAMTNPGTPATDFGLGRILGQEMSKQAARPTGSIYSAAMAAPAPDSKGGSGKGRGGRRQRDRRRRHRAVHGAGVVDPGPRRTMRGRHLLGGGDLPRALRAERLQRGDAAGRRVHAAAHLEDHPRDGQDRLTARPSALDLVDRFKTPASRPPAEGACCVVS